MFCEDYIKFENRIKQDIEKINNENKINDVDINEYNNLVKEFKNILENDKISANTKQEQIENYFLFKYKNCNDK